MIGPSVIGDHFKRDFAFQTYGLMEMDLWKTYVVVPGAVFRRRRYIIIN